jgi:3-(3-hydroxy-phenyl)propionate hydroxylase
MCPGSAADDAPFGNGWLLPKLGGRDFTLLRFGAEIDCPLASVQAISDEAIHRYDARLGTAYLIRPDQHVAARWRQPTRAAVDAALARAQGHAA